MLLNGENLEIDQAQVLADGADGVRDPRYVQIFDPESRMLSTEATREEVSPPTQDCWLRELTCRLLQIFRGYHNTAVSEVPTHVTE